MVRIWSDQPAEASLLGRKLINGDARDGPEGILGRRGLESGPKGPVKGFDAPKITLWATALA
ncbi:MAG: hypothetical protein AAGA36_08010, partial [Pseudomonadota bacterium]